MTGSDRPKKVSKQRKKRVLVNSRGEGRLNTEVSVVLCVVFWTVVCVCLIQKLLQLLHSPKRAFFSRFSADNSNKWTMTRKEPKKRSVIVMCTCNVRLARRQSIVQTLYICVICLSSFFFSWRQWFRYRQLSN